MNRAHISNVGHVTSAHTPFEPLCASRTALLTTFRRNGQGVATVVEIHVVGGKAYFHTWSTTGKVKRLAHNPQVRLAPCTWRGDVVGPTVEGVARRLEGRDAERTNAALGGRLLRWLWKQVYRRRWGAEQMLYEVSPTHMHPSHRGGIICGDTTFFRKQTEEII
jgi:uncharacterized protein